MFLCRKRSSEFKKTQFCTLVEQKITKAYPVCAAILHDVFYLVRQMKHFCVVFTWASFSRMRITSDYRYGRNFLFGATRRGLEVAQWIKQKQTGSQVAILI